MRHGMYWLLRWRHARHGLSTPNRNSIDFFLWSFLVSRRENSVDGYTWRTDNSGSASIKYARGLSRASHCVGGGFDDYHIFAFNVDSNFRSLVYEVIMINIRCICWNNTWLPHLIILSFSTQCGVIRGIGATRRKSETSVILLDWMRVSILVCRVRRCAFATEHSEHRTHQNSFTFTME